MRCNQCQALMINGIFCHETGCPNSRKVYDVENDRWVRYLECRECGREIEEGAACDCTEIGDRNET